MIGELHLKETLAGNAAPREKSTRPGRLFFCPRLDRTALILAVWSVPVSIAVTEFFLSFAILARIVRLASGRDRIILPRCFWFWLLWAGSEILVWGVSPQPSRGWGEIRHLLLLGGLFLVLPAIDNVADYRIVWKGVFLTSTLSSVFLVGDFLARLSYYHREISGGGDVGLYLRSGGLLNHWMVYGTVEILVIAGLLSFWFAYHQERRQWWPVAATSGVAVVLSLTRMVWVTCLVLWGIATAWGRSKWFWALPLLPLGLYVLAPMAVHLRVRQSFEASYYSNSERVQMLRVGWKMVRNHPLTGVGPGRVDQLYRSYLSPQDPIPAWHGHLHNNIVQIAAQFGIPVTLASLLFVAILFHDLVKANRAAQNQDERFVTRTGLLALVGYALAGLFEYTYGHSLGLILLGFAVIPALVPGISGGRSVDSVVR